MTKKKYKLTPEHRAKLPEWRDKWIANAFRCGLTTEADRTRAVEAVCKMYDIAKLPRPKHIVFVPSPMVLALAGGFAAGIWWAHKNREWPNGSPATRAATGAATEDATRVATWAATRVATRAATGAATEDATRVATWAATRVATEAATGAATEDATEAATEAATWAATRAATRAATEDATEAATEAATWAATRAATEDATRVATWAATRVATEDATGAATRAATGAATEDATRVATEDATKWYVTLTGVQIGRLAALIAPGQEEFLIRCADNALNMWNGGCDWSAYPAFLSFFRHIAKLDIEYVQWEPYETLAEFGPRIMHADFCMISERHIELHLDEQHRPHCETGPFRRWVDGTACYAIHGTRVPAWIVENPEQITVATIEAETNAEVRRVMVERFGLTRYVKEAGFELIDSETDMHGQPRRLLRRAQDLVVELVNSTEDADGTRRTYHIPVHPELRPLLSDGRLGEPQKLTARNAVASTFGLRGEEYELEFES